MIFFLALYPSVQYSYIKRTKECSRGREENGLKKNVGVRTYRINLQNKKSEGFFFLNIQTNNKEAKNFLSVQNRIPEMSRLKQSASWSQIAKEILCHLVSAVTIGQGREQGLEQMIPSVEKNSGRQGVMVLVMQGSAQDEEGSVQQDLVAWRWGRACDHAPPYGRQPCLQQH